MQALEVSSQEEPGVERQIGCRTALRARGRGLLAGSSPTETSHDHFAEEEAVETSSGHRQGRSHWP